METLDVVSRNVCGLDVHTKTVVACRRRVHSGGKVDKEVKSFGTTTAALQALLTWMEEWQVSHGAMESTGVYGKPVWNVLEGHVALFLVNARHLKMVPGRKTDVKDGEWIAQLLQYGLLRASVVPTPEVRQWRELTRHRTKLSDQHTAVVNRVHKTLEDANITLGAVISDIMGVSGRRRLRAMAAGQEDAATLAALGHERLKAPPTALQASLRGKLTAPHRFMLETLWDQGEFLEQQITRLDERIEECLRPFEAQIPRLDSLDGVDRRGAQNLLAALGPQMAQCPDADHLCSWAGMSPGNNESAGKRHSGKTTKGKTWLRRTFTQAAWAATRRKGGYWAAQYRRLAARRGTKRAIVAVGHTMLVAASHMLQDEVDSRDRGAAYFDQQRRERTTAQFVSRLQHLGYTVTLAPMEEPAA